MKKIFVILFLINMLFAKCYALTLEGQVSYNEETARTVTFENVQRTISMEQFAEHMIDKNYKDNKYYMKFGLESSDRTIEMYKTGKFKLAYAITYDENMYRTYYYTKLGGYLLFLDIAIKNQGEDIYPVKVYRYDYKGQLLAAGLYASENEAFLYDKDGKLLVHRIDDSGYNSNGKKLWRAEEVTF